MQGGDAPDVWLDLAHLLRAEPAQASQPVLGAALLQVLQPRDLGVVHRHDELAADIVWNGVFAAELRHLRHAADGEPGLERAGLVIEATVQHAAVVRALVAAHACFFFEDSDARVRQPSRELDGGGHAHDAAADDEEVLLSHNGADCARAGSGWQVRAL